MTRRAASVLPAGVPPLAQLYIYVAGSCNLACRHCWIIPSFSIDGSSGTYVALPLVRKAVVEARELGLKSVKLTGGEPMLHPQFRSLVELIAATGVDIVVETNGTLIDLGLAEFLRGTEQVRFVSVSLDGATAAIHEALRMVEGSFDRAVEGIRHLRAVGYAPQIICTLHAGNLDEARAVVALAAELGCESVKFNHIQQVGRGRSFAASNGVEVETLVRLSREFEAERSADSPVRVIFDIPTAFHSVHRLVSEKPSHCGILTILGLLSNGDLALCGIGTSVPELVYGNIEHDRLSDVWSTSPGLAELRRVIPAELSGICSRCIHQYQCLGNCVAANYHATRKLGASFRFCTEAEEQGLFPRTRLKAGENDGSTGGS